MILCTGYMFSFSNFGALAFTHFLANSSSFDTNTRIASIDISELTQDKALSLLKSKQKNWEKSTSIKVAYREKTIKLNLDIFDFQLEQSVETAKSAKQTELLVQIDEDKLNTFLSELSSNLVKNHSIDTKAFKKNLLSYASLLESGNHTIQMDQYLLKKEKNDLLSETSISLGNNGDELANWVKQFPQLEIKPGSSFSLTKIIADRKITTYSAKTLSRIATAVYQVILPTNFLITERHISRELPRYAEPGFEAKVDPDKNMDLVFTNSNDEKFFLNFKIMDQTFYVSLNGPKFEYTYKIVQKDKETFQPKTIIQFDAKLPFNSEKVVTDGKEGLIIKTYCEQLDETGEPIKNTLLSEDFYSPINKVIIHSLLMKDSNSTTNEADANKQDGSNSSGTSSNNENETTSDSSSTPNDTSNNDKTVSSKVNNENETNSNSSDLWGNQNEVSK